MSNREKLINLQRRFEKDARYFADKEDYTFFEKVVEDFIVEAGKINPDINTKDLLSRHLSKAGKVKSYSDALQVMNSVSSDITILSMDLHGKGEPIYTTAELDKLKRDNNIEYTKNSFDIFKKSFDLIKKNNSDRFSKIDDLRSLYLGNVKNYKDKVFKFPHLVDTEQRKLFDTLKSNITKQVFDTFEKDKEILLSYVSEIAEIGKAYVDRNVDFSDRLLDGYHIQRRREVIGESVDLEKLRRDLDVSNEKNIESLIDSIKKCFENYIKGVENLMTEHYKLYNDRIERTRAERIILGGQDEVKGIIERYKKQLEDIITSELSKDEEVFYSILGELKNSVNESDESTNLYEVSGEFEYNIKFNFSRLRDDVLDDFDLMKKKQIDLQKEHLQKILNGENVNQDISKEIMDVIKEYEYKTESLYKRFRDDIQVDCENFIENLYDIYTGNVDKNKAKDFAKRFVSKGLSDVQEIERNLIYKTNMEMKKVSMESYKKLIGKPFTKRDIDTHIGELISFYEGRRERTEGFFDLGWKKVKKTTENFINEFGLDVVYLNESKFNNISLNEGNSGDFDVIKDAVYAVSDIAHDYINDPVWDIANEIAELGKKVYIENGDFNALYKEAGNIFDKNLSKLEKANRDLIQACKRRLDKELKNLEKVFGRDNSTLKLIKTEFDNSITKQSSEYRNKLTDLKKNIEKNTKDFFNPRSYDNKEFYPWINGISMDFADQVMFSIDDINTEILKKAEKDFEENGSVSGGNGNPAKKRDIKRDLEKLKLNLEPLSKNLWDNFTSKSLNILYKLEKQRHTGITGDKARLKDIQDAVLTELDKLAKGYNDIVIGAIEDIADKYKNYSNTTKFYTKAMGIVGEYTTRRRIYKEFHRKFDRKVDELFFHFFDYYGEKDHSVDLIHNKFWELGMSKFQNMSDFVDYAIDDLLTEVSEMNESKSISESRRDIFFEAEEEKKPKISKEEKEKLKAQLDNFFVDKKEAKAIELKKSIADRDKAIEDVILKYSTEKEKIQREYSKNIQAAKSEAEANKLRAERDEELQRLSLEKATSIEDLKERQKKEEASIREKYQTLFDKKLEEYKDSLGDAIHDFAKDIERGIEDGIKSNPIFQ